jgi:hypothetical protein
VIVDIDATLVSAHSDKEGAQPTFKKGFGFAPMWGCQMRCVNGSLP